MANQLDPRMIDSSKSATTLNATQFISPSGNSNIWDDTSSLVRSNSATWNITTDLEVRSLSSNWQSTYNTVNTLSSSWEETADILPTVTNYLSTSNVLLSGLTVTGNISATGTVYSTNTLTTSICAMSGNGSTPFVMQFTNGLLTSITI